MYETQSHILLEKVMDKRDEREEVDTEDRSRVHQL